MADREDQGYVLSKSASHLLHRAQQLAADRFAANITLRQFAVLTAISTRSGQSQTDLVNATGIDRSTLADMILRMEERGLLARVRSSDDARAKAVTLTTAGRAALNAATPHARRADEAIMSALPRAARAQFLDTLRVLAEAADAAPSEEGARTRKSAKAPRKPARAKRAKR